MALHSLWMGYMSELLALAPPPSGSGHHDHARAMPHTAAMHAKLIKADFHGSIVTGTSSVHILPPFRGGVPTRKWTSSFASDVCTRREAFACTYSRVCLTPIRRYTGPESRITMAALSLTLLVLCAETLSLVKKSTVDERSLRWTLPNA